VYLSNKAADSVSYKAYTLCASQSLKFMKSIVFIDSNVQDYQYLVQAVTDNTTVKIINSEADGIQQITQYLAKENYSEVNIVAHGSPGCLYLGNSQLSLDTLEYYTGQLKIWSVASILIYGCNVAAVDAGVEFIDKLHQITGAEIAASTHKIGHFTLGGNWKLNIKTYDFDVFLPFDSRVKTQWNHVLEPTPFAEEPNFYQVISGQLKLLNPLTGQYEDIGPVQSFYNGAGFGKDTNNNLYIYGVGTQGTIKDKVIRVGSNGEIEQTSITLPSGSTGQDYNAGDVDFTNNDLWVRLKKTGLELVKVDLDTNTNQTVTFTKSGTFTNPEFVSDLVYISSEKSQVLTGVDAGNALYGVENNRLYIWNLDTKILTSKPITGLPTPANTYGAGWTDVDGRLYVSSNNEGKLFRIDAYASPSPTVEEITTTEITTLNDGMSDPGQRSPYVIPLIDLDGDNSSNIGSPNYETTFTEDSGGIGIVEPNNPTDETADIIIKDFDTPNQIRTATITLTNTKDGDNFIVGSLPTGITSDPTTDASGNLVLTLSAAADITPENWELALEAIQFNNTSDTPDTEPRKVQVFLTDVANYKGNTGTTTINIVPVNDAPSFNGLDGTPTFSIGGGAIVLDADATIIDSELDNTNYNGATLTLQRNGGANAEDVFSNSGTLDALTEGGNLVVNGVTVGTVTTNSNGTLTLTFNASATGDLVNQVLQQITYSNNGATSATSIQIDYTINDGNTGVQGTSTPLALAGSGSITVNITTNNTPTVSSISKTGTEDNNILFTADDFTSQFTDIDDDSLTKIQITSLPENGTLILNGNPVTVNEEIDVTQLGNLVFTPDENFNGDTSFGWNGFDGTSYADTPATVNISINSDNDVPTVNDLSKTGLEDNTILFTADDFTSQFTDIDGDSLTKIQITSLPENGTLTLNDNPVSLDDEIDVTQLGNLVFTPDENFNGDTSFGWNGFDGNSYAETPGTVNISIGTTTNNPPTVSDNSVQFNNNSQDNELGITAPTDPENDNLTITVTTLPNLGTVTKADGTPVSIGDILTPEELAGLLYNTPENYNGTDELGSFSYNVSDGVNTVPGTVNIDIISPDTDTDGDGIPDINDLDDDNDGIFDSNEGDGDTDGDGIPDSLDLDSDNDGVPDLNESGLTPDQINQLDTDGDGIIDPSNNFGENGVIDSLETTPDSGQLDLNGDGQPDDPIDTDQDGVPDFQDLDSDNDGIPDVTEAGGTDTDGDGLIDGANIDTDGDGLADAVDPDNGGTAVAIPDIDNDGVADFRDLDSDNDGISDLIEGGQDPAVVDTDGNGIIDGSDSDGDGILDVIDDNDGFSDANNDPLPDADADGTPDYQEIDSDNDGTPDRVEAGLPTGEGTPDVNGDGQIDDPTDTDGDGVPDSIDTLPDGDGGFETPTQPINQPPTVASNSIRVDVTSDNNNLGLSAPTDPENDNLTITISSIPTLGSITKADGTIVNIGDSLTPAELAELVYNAPDNYNGSDDLGEFSYDVNDGVNTVAGKVDITVVNPNVDSDGDGVPDINDLDDDNDGVLDIDEGEGDKDGDNIPNVLDLDSDNDGIPDLYESGLPLDQASQLDTDGNGVIDPTNDFGNNGFADRLENPPDSGQVDYNGDGQPDTPVDTDSDNTSDFQDLDSDNDGINDVIEAGGTDADNDGLIDGTDTDTDGDGLADSVDPDNGGTANIPPDTDSDNVPDFRDLDSDNDGINDIIEGGSPDPDGDGVIGGEDTDSDGIPDIVDNNDSGFGNSGGTPTPDTDNDGSPDYLDLDSDNDGTNDIIEVGLTDPDGDGRLDAEDTDSDGIPNAVDNNDGGFGNSGTPPLPDTDNDGIPDFRDVDTPPIPSVPFVPVPTIPVDNQSPVAVDDTPNTPQDQSVVIDVLENDKDDSLLNPGSVVVVTEPNQGTVVNNQNGTLTYTPNSEYIGSDSFSYTVQDQDGNLSNIATVTISVNAQGTIDTECCQCPEPPQLGEKILPTPPEVTASNLNATNEADLLVGTVNDDVITALAGNDTLVSGEGNNLIYTGLGDDLVFSSTENDTLYGELGKDTLIGGPSGLEAIGDSGDQDILFGDENNDWLVGSLGQDTLHSGKDDDEAFGGKDDDWVMGEQGNDTILGDMGNDTILGGTNNLPDDPTRDTFGEDWLFGGEGNDFMDGNEANDTLVAGVGDDTVHGGKQNDWLWGEAGNDMMFGDIGNDSLCGGEGNDTLRGDQIDDGNSPSVGANGQQDKLSGGVGNDLLFGDEGQDTLCGGDDNDTLHGGKDDDLLKGCSGDDLLLGEMGNDSLVGGNGNDTLTGGEGNNYFVLEFNSGEDVITDFQVGQDNLVLAEGLTLSSLQINAEGDNTVITLNSEIIATLVNVDAAAILPSDILI